MWDAQIPALTGHFRVLRYDTRGHGQTSVTTGPYTIEMLGRDVLALFDFNGIERAHFCGLSMGGMIGMWLGINAPKRIAKLILCDTAARIGTADTWNARIAKVKESGMPSITPAVLERWFTPEFFAKAPATLESMRRMLIETPGEGYAACCAAVRDGDFRESVSAIKSKTLMIVGSHDPVTPPRDAQFLAERISGAQCVEVPASHLANVEAPGQFTGAVQKFLRE